MISRNEQHQCDLGELRQEHASDVDGDDLPGHGDEGQVHRGGARQVKWAVSQPAEEHGGQQCGGVGQEGGWGGGEGPHDGDRHRKHQVGRLQKDSRVTCFCGIRVQMECLFPNEDKCADPEVTF